MLRGVIVGVAGALAMCGVALAQANPWVSLARGDLAPCTDTFAEFQKRWLSAVAVDRDEACKGSNAEMCQSFRDWHDNWKVMSPIDFMMDAPAECAECVDEHMIDEFIEPAFAAAVPVIVVRAASARPSAPALRKDHTDGVKYMGVVYHCLSGLWVQKLFASGQTLESVKVTAQEAALLKTTPAGFEGMVKQLTQRYAAGRPAVAAAPKPAAPPEPALPPQNAALRVAVRDCGDPDGTWDKRTQACSAAINGGAGGAELVMAHWARSVLRLQDGDVEGAIQDADAAGDLYGQDYSVQNARCWSRAVGDTDLDIARQACTLAIRLAPDEASVYDSRGLVGLRQKRWADAWTDYDEAVLIDPTFASALYGRGLAALGLGEGEAGRQDIADAVELYPEIAAEYASYGLEPGSIAVTGPKAARGRTTTFAAPAQ